MILRPSVVVGRAAYGGSALFRGLAGLPVLPLIAEAGPLQVVQLDDVVNTVLFFLRPEDPLDSASHVVLTSAGRCLAVGGALVPASDAPLAAAGTDGPTLATRYAAELDALPAGEPGCLGLGRLPPWPPAFLHVAIRDGSVLQRCFRDIHTASQHVFIGEKIYADAGSVLLGAVSDVIGL